jgi:hypothetical protein
MRYIYVSLLTIFVFSCREKAENNGLVFNYREDISGTEIFSDLKLIKLETSDTCQIAHIRQILIYDNKIYVLDSPVGKSILVFDMNGKCLHKIEQAGQGPGEYVLPLSISIHENILYVMDAAQSKILLFDCSTCAFIKEEKNKIEAPYFSILDRNTYLWSNTLEIDFNQSSYPFHLMVTDSNYQVRYTAAPMDIRTGNILRWTFPFTHGEQGAYFVHPYQNKIYELFADTCRLKYTVNFEGFQFPPTDFLKDALRSDQFVNIVRKSSYINQFTYLETGGYIISSFYAKENFYMGLFNKNRQEGICFNMKDIIKDIHFGCYNNPQACSQGKFYSVIEASKIVENRKNGLIPETLLNEINDINEDDNPVILRYGISY